MSWMTKDDEINILKSENKELKTIIENLKRELITERKAVDLYADPDSWFYETGLDTFRSRIGSYDVCKIPEYPSEKDFFGGRLAREAQAKRKMVVV